MSSRLDQLIYDVRLDVKSHREHERIVGEAEAIAESLRAVFRKPTPVSEPVHPPLRQGDNWAAW